MKKFSKVIFLALLAIAILIPLAIAFQDVYGVILNIGKGSFVVGLLLLPFVIIGTINVFRGFGAVIEMDEAKFGRLFKGWKFYVYLFFYIGGYLALYYVLVH